MWFKRIRKSNIWKLTDDVIKIKDIVDNQVPDFSSKFKLSGTMTCMRDMNKTNIYIFKGEETYIYYLVYSISINDSFYSIGINKRSTPTSLYF